MCLILCLVVLRLPDFVQGIPLSFSTKFVNGDVTFSWSGSSSEYYTVSTFLDKRQSTWCVSQWTPWCGIQGKHHTVESALLYDSIIINVSLPSQYTDNSVAFKVSKIESLVGDSANLSWTATFFPRAGGYNIYHTDKVNRSIIQVGTSGATLDQIKYVYHSHPYSSTDIMFEIKDITVDDAGYYAGGIIPEAAWTGPGVVLIVHDRPSKPQIRGNLNVIVKITSELTCFSKSNSAPDYYARLFPLSYTWFVNNTELAEETRETLRFLVTRDHKYNQYSCTAKGKLESDRSDTVKINPLYKTGKLTIIPQPLLNVEDKLAVKEGESVSPYNCTVDCNPPCDIAWTYKYSDGRFYNASSENGMLATRIVNRSIELIRCVATFAPDGESKLISDIKLDVHYLDEPQVVINENAAFYSYQTVHVKEKSSFRLSCHVNGNPSPSIRLHRDAVIGNIAEMNSTEWLTHTINSLQCSDTDTYTCTGESNEFNDTKKKFQVNVNCEPRFDESVSFKSNYSSISGEYVSISVAVPVVANPPPQESDITWSGPTGNLNTYSYVFQQNVIYKHMIETLIPIEDPMYFGNYTMKYRGKSLITVFIFKEESSKSTEEDMVDSMVKKNFEKDSNVSTVIYDEDSTTLSRLAQNVTLTLSDRNLIKTIVFHIIQHYDQAQVSH